MPEAPFALALGNAIADAFILGRLHYYPITAEVRLEFALVIATRNRQPVLQLSLPLMLEQARPPGQLIIVDASDDHEQIKTTVERIVAETRCRPELQIIQSAAGSAHQRNVGLAAVECPVVFFPDDDALWFPHVAERVMRIYEQDCEEIVGGVGPVESSVPPPGLFQAAAVSKSMDLRDRLQLSVGRILDCLEYRFFPDPLFIEGAARYEGNGVHARMGSSGPEPANVFAGFRMSFRTALIRRTGFDTALGRYALFEDYDACLGILKDHLLVDAPAAPVFHRRMPEKRVNGIEWGVIQILNRAYVVCKHSPPLSLARRRLLPFSWYKLVRYLAQAQTPYGRQRVKGVMKALPLVRECCAAPQSKLRECYLDLRARCLS